MTPADLACMLIHYQQVVNARMLPGGYDTPMEIPGSATRGPGMTVWFPVTPAPIPVTPAAIPVTPRQSPSPPRQSPSSPRQSPAYLRQSPSTPRRRGSPCPASNQPVLRTHTRQISCAIPFSGSCQLPYAAIHRRFPRLQESTTWRFCLQGKPVPLPQSPRSRVCARR